MGMWVEVKRGVVVIEHQRLERLGKAIRKVDRLCISRRSSSSSKDGNT